MRKLIRTGVIALLMTTNVVAANDIEQKEIPTYPKSIASFDLGIVDTLDLINSPVKALPKQSLPKYLNQYKTDQYIDIGGLKTPDFEALKALKPDVIVISARQQAMYDELAKIAPTVNLSVNPKEYENSFKNNMLLIGKVFNKLPEMSKELVAVDTQAAKVKQYSKQSLDKALIVVHYKGRLMTSEPSNYGGLIHDWLGIKQVDLTNIKKENKDSNAERLTLTSKEVALVNPDILFVIDRGEAIGEGALDKKQLEDNYIQQTNAYKNKKIIYLTPDLWYLSGNGLQSIMLQMAEVEQAFKK